MLAVNVKAIVHVAQAAHLPLARTRGAFLVMASNKGLVAQSRLARLRGHQGCGVQLARALALDWARRESA